MENQLIEKPKTLKDILGDPKYKARIEELMKERANTFILSLLSLVNGSPALAECEPVSLLNAALTAASLNLPMNPGLGYAYPVPYNDKRSGMKKAQFQIGAKGFIQLALRPKLIKTINVTDVKEGEYDPKNRNRLTGEIIFNWIEDEVARKKALTVGYVSYFKLHDGFEKMLFMTSEDLKSHAQKYSQAYKSKMGPWIDDFESMGEKTVIKLLLSKWAPTSSDIEKARMADQAILDDDGYKYVDNQIDSAKDVSREKEFKRIYDFIWASKTHEEMEKVREFVMDYDLQADFDARWEEIKGGKK